MDRVNNSSSAATNTSYSANSCDVPPTQPEPTASCPDGSVTYDAGVCEATGLKGPPTAAQRYLALLTDTNSASTGGTTATTSPPAGIEEVNSAANAVAVQQLIDESREVALATIRAAIKDATVNGGSGVTHALKLPNGCELSFSIQATVQQTANAEPALGYEVSAALEATFGVASGRVELSYSQTSAGKETFAFEACVFGGVKAGTDDVMSAEAQAGLCAKFKDGVDAPAEFQLDAVAKAGFSIKASELFEWETTAEVRTPLSREVLPFDVIP